MSILKITFFGLTISSSWGNGHATPYRAIIRALHRLGHQVTFFEKDVEYYYWRRDFNRCGYCDLVLYSSWDDVRKQALTTAADSDVVIVGSYCPEGALIADEILSLGHPIKIFYDLDTPITIENLRAQDLEYLRRDQMSAFDLYLSFTGGAILDELECEWKVRLARPLYGCVDPDVHVRVRARDEYRCDLSYMGTYASDRQAKLDALFVETARLTPDSSFILAGSLYPKSWTWPVNVKRFDHIAPANHPAFYSSSRATLNITREGMARGGYCPSGRFFEAAACGTPIVSDWFEGLDTFFARDEIHVVETGLEVASVLHLAEADLARMADRARQRVLSEHTGDVRASQLLSFIDEAGHLVSSQRRSRSGNVNLDRAEVNS